MNQTDSERHSTSQNKPKRLKIRFKLTRNDPKQIKLTQNDKIKQPNWSKSTQTDLNWHKPLINY